MLANQFLRVAGEIKRCHDARLKKETNLDEVDKALSYYLDEKHIILGKMKHLFENETELETPF